MLDSKLIIEAPAKINLALHITGQREDGYHSLDSLVVFGAARDRLIFQESDHLHLSVTGPFGAELAGEPSNLVVKAARMLAEQLGEKPKGAITLEKNLPVSSGIGGGSADAAASLVGFLRLWQRTMSDDRLKAIALELGADVPMCLEGLDPDGAGRERTCLHIGGIGEVLNDGPILPADLGIVLVNPRIAISTPALFKTLRQHENPPLGPFPSAFLSARALGDWLANQRNDMQMAAIEQSPIIESVLQALGDDERCLFARMSGSGATCFGLYPSKKIAQKAAHHLSFTRPNWWISSGPLS